MKNINQGDLDGITLPLVCLWESSYDITEKGKLSVGLEKENNFDFCCKFAGRYDIFPALTLLSSYQFEPNRIGLGTVFNVMQFQLTYSIRTHQYLDLTHYISISYEVFN